MSIVNARRPAALLGLAVLTLGVTMTAGAAPALAAAQTRYVATTGNDGADPVNDCTSASEPCRTVAHAVDEAAAGDTVSIATGTYAESVQIAKSLTVTGAGRSATTVRGRGADPSFDIEDVAPDTGQGVTLEHLGVSGNSSAPGIVAVASSVSMLDTEVKGNGGAGVDTFLSTLTVSHSTISRTTDSGGAGAPFAGGAGITVVLGSAAVDHTTTADNAGAGVELIGEAVLPGAVRSLVAGAPAPGASLTLTRSTVSGNGVGGVVSGGGEATLAADTVSGNTGGGVVSFAGTAAVLDTTVVGTVAFPASEGNDEQGGLIALAADGLSGNAQLSSALRPAAGAKELKRLLGAAPAAARRAARHLARAAAAPGTAAIEVSGSIVAQQDGVADCFGTPADSGDNLSSDAGNSCAFSIAKHDERNTDPRLGPLADNGGATKTHLPLKGSPAIDAIPAGRAGCAAGTTDQRGTARPQPTGGWCDTGAVELAAAAIVIHPATLPKGTVGKAYAATVTATGGAYPTYTWALSSGSVPTGLRFTASGRLSGTPTTAGTFTFAVSVNDPVTKSYTVVIAAAPTPTPTPTPPPPPAPAPAGNGDAPIASTGAHVGPLLVVGSVAVLLGLVLVIGAGGGFAAGRRPRHLIP